VDIDKVVIKILQDSAVTQTTLGWLTVDPLIANFLWSVCQNCEKLGAIIL